MSDNRIVSRRRLRDGHTPTGKNLARERSQPENDPFYASSPLGVFNDVIYVRAESAIALRAGGA